MNVEEVSRKTILCTKLRQNADAMTDDELDRTLQASNRILEGADKKEALREFFYALYHYALDTARDDSEASKARFDAQMEYLAKKFVLE